MLLKQIPFFFNRPTLANVVIESSATEMLKLMFICINNLIATLRGGRQVWSFYFINKPTFPFVRLIVGGGGGGRGDV